MKFLLVLFVLFFLSADLYGEQELKSSGKLSETEAGDPNLNKISDFCCDREFLGGSAQDISEQESQRIVKNVLGQENEVIRPRLSPSHRKAGTR